MKQASRSPVVVVADDLGHSPAINAGILRAFEEGMISCASIMANMPSFEDAIAAVKHCRLEDRVGVHLNLTEGRSLTEAIRSCPRFARPDGTLVWRRVNALRLERAEREAVTAEWRAQIQRVRSAGIQPCHLDSHQHAHTVWPIGAIAIGLALETGIPAVRLSRNCKRTGSLLVRLYKRLFNERIRRSGLARVCYFGSANEVASILPSARGPVEVMTHPTLASDGRLLNHTDGAPLAASLVALDLAGRMVCHRELSLQGSAWGPSSPKQG